MKDSKSKTIYSIEIASLTIVHNTAKYITQLKFGDPSEPKRVDKNNVFIHCVQILSNRQYCHLRS